MLARPLLLLALAAPAAFAGDRIWAIDQAMVTVEHGPAKARVAAFSTDLHGAVKESGDGLTARLALPASSFRTGAAARDATLHELAGDVTIDVTTDANEGTTHLRGTLTFHGVAQPIDVLVTLARSGRELWAHTAFNLRLRDFGPGLPDELLAIDVDVGLRTGGAAVASR